MSGLTQKEIPLVYKKGRRFRTDSFSVFFQSSNELKLSVVVSKKISKKAVIRNKIKRRVRHLSREFLNKGKIIVVVKENISSKNFEKLKDEFKKIANRIN
ncbi:MAG: ribonuclease P protein component [Epsilonproteobacteria bacterium]|nr:ribonuclease P protein component [Campylobacterota bacterium]